MPTVQEIVCGPLFTYIASFFDIIAGAAIRVDIITAVYWAPAVLGALMVTDSMIFLGKRIGDWKTGLLSALFIAVIGVNSATVLFMDILITISQNHSSPVYSVSATCSRCMHSAIKKIDFKEFSTFKLPILIWSYSCGKAYFLGHLTMTYHGRLPYVCSRIYSDPVSPRINSQANQPSISVVST